MTTKNKLEEAKLNCETFRAEMESAKAGSKRWRLAEESLNFWQGKVATYGAMIGGGN